MEDASFWFNVTAVAGALAWLPHLGGWLARLFSRPRVRTILAPTLAIGYTGHGPVAICVAALLGERKDAVIERLSLAFRHEGGRALDLQWASIGPTIARVAINLGVIDGLGLGHRAIALPLRTGAAIQDVFEFRSDEFWDGTIERITAVMEAARVGVRTAAAEVPGDVRNSRAFVDLVDHYRSGFKWESGRYTVFAVADLMGETKPQAHGWRFSLAESDVERLQRNTVNLEKHFSETVPEAAVPQDDDEWYWAYVKLEDEGEFKLVPL